MTTVASQEKPWPVIYDQRSSQSVNDNNSCAQVVPWKIFYDRNIVYRVIVGNFGLIGSH